jgi:hypothetical protein
MVFASMEMAGRARLQSLPDEADIGHSGGVVKAA